MRPEIVGHQRGQDIDIRMGDVAMTRMLDLTNVLPLASHALNQADAHC